MKIKKMKMKPVKLGKLHLKSLVPYRNKYGKY